MKRLYKYHRKIALPRLLAAWVATGMALAGCVEEYWPGLGEKYEAVLVVDGRITDQPGPYEVRLSLSTSMDKPEFRPLTGYQVSILDDAGHTEMLTDRMDGSYVTDAQGLQGVPGRSYKLRVISPAGHTYESGFEEMQEPLGVDTVWAEFETREDLAYDHLLEGYRFRVTTEVATRDSVYLLWKLTGTYQYHANHYIKYYYDGEMHPFPRYDSLYMCWRTYPVHEIFTHHTLNLSEPVLRGYPLHYVNTEDKKLSIRYSLYTEQYVISRQAHEYWKNLEEQGSDLGSLYAVMPFQVRGNVRNVNDPEELVLGYFLTAPVTGHRMFVKRPWWARFHYATECAMIKDFAHQLWLWRNKWPLYLAAEYSEYGQAPALPVSQECVDCTKSGGSIVKPDFWIDSQPWEKTQR